MPVDSGDRRHSARSGAAIRAWRLTQARPLAAGSASETTITAPRRMNRRWKRACRRIDGR